jgi:tyrosyl-tRNA synthetase
MTEQVFSFSDVFNTSDKVFAIGDKKFTLKRLNIRESAEIDSNALEIHKQIEVIAKILSARCTKGSVSAEWLKEAASMEMLDAVLKSLISGKLPGEADPKAG